MARWAAAALCLSVILMAACGGGTRTVTLQSATTDSTPSDQPARVDYQRCQQQLGDLLHAEQQLDSRLDIGLTYDDYGNRLGDVQVEYKQVPFKQLGDTCTAEVGVPAENALNEYVKSENIWTKCFDDPDCDDSSIKDSLRQHWSKATQYVDRANRGLASMAP